MAGGRGRGARPPPGTAPRSTACPPPSFETPCQTDIPCPLSILARRARLQSRISQGQPSAGCMEPAVGTRAVWQRSMTARAQGRLCSRSLLNYANLSSAGELLVWPFEQVLRCMRNFGPNDDRYDVRHGSLGANDCDLRWSEGEMEWRECAHAGGGANNPMRAHQALHLWVL